MKFTRRYKPTGWTRESWRHSLAAKGVKTNSKINSKFTPDFDSTMKSKIGQDKEGVKLSPEAEKELVKKIAKAEAKIAKAEPQILNIRTGKRETPAVGAGRVKAQEELEKALIEAGPKKDLSQELERIEYGDMAALSDLYRNAKSDTERLQIKDAAFKGALARARRGEQIGKDVNSIISRSQQDIVNREYLIATTGSASTRLERAEGAAGKVGMYALEESEATLKSAGKELMRREKTSLEKRQDELEELRLRKSLDKQEQAAEKGTLNPLGIEWMGGADKKEQEMSKYYPDALRSQKEVDTIYDNSDSLAEVDMSAYQKGERAFRSGNREELISSITDLESENMKLKDRWHMVQKTRGLVVSQKNMEQTVSMDSAQEANVVPNFVFSGGGASKLADQTKKISAVENKIQQNSNKVVGRIGILRQKLRRMNASVPADSTVPRRIQVLEDGARLDASDSLSMGKGLFKHENPVLGTRENEI